MPRDLLKHKYTARPRIAYTLLQTDEPTLRETPLYHSHLANRDLMTRLFINMLRDFVWPLLTFLSVNSQFQKTDDMIDQTAAQQLYSTLAMLAGIATLYAAAKIYRCNNNDDERPTWSPLRIASLSTTAAALSIIPWNYAQYRGSTDLVPAQFNQQERGYFCGIHTGIAEAIVQYFIYLAGLLITNHANERAKWTMEQKWQRVLEILLNTLFPGLLPGAVWQWMYFWNPAHAHRSLPGLLLDSAAVSVSVGASNLAVCKFIERVMHATSPHPTESSTCQSTPHDASAERTHKNSL